MREHGRSVKPPIRVVVDAMGGDYGPPETVKGGLEAFRDHSIELILVGDQDAVEKELANYDTSGKVVRVVPSEGKIGDDEHPIEGLRRKPKSSIMVTTKLLKSGDADVAVSMGSTGALHGQFGICIGVDGRVRASLYWRPIPGRRATYRPA